MPRRRALLLGCCIVAASIGVWSPSDGEPVPIAITITDPDRLRSAPVVMCALRWDDYAADPSAFPMARDLVAASLCSVKSKITTFGELEDEHAARCEAAPATCVLPAGLVFHQARCGSTLVANLLASLPGSLVYSESKVIHDVLGAGLDEATRTRVLRVMVGAMGRRVGPAGRLFLKLQSTLTLHLSALRAAFPATPWLFVHREGVEVLASHFREVRGTPPHDATPGARLAMSLLGSRQSGSIPCLRSARAVAALPYGQGGWPLLRPTSLDPLPLLVSLAAALPPHTPAREMGVEDYCAVHTGALAAAALAAAAEARAEGVDALLRASALGAGRPMAAFTVLDGDSFSVALSALRQGSGGAATEDGPGQIGGVGQGLPLMYDGSPTFPRAVIGALASHFGMQGLEAGGGLERRLLEVASHYSKTRKPSTETTDVWADDSDAKQSRAWPVLRRAAELYVAPFTAALKHFAGGASPPPLAAAVRKTKRSAAVGGGVAPPPRQPLLPLGGGYPALFPLTDVLSYWSADITTPPPDYGQYSSLARLDWRVPADRERAQQLRRAELPFVISSLPSLDATVARWSSDEALLEDMGGSDSKHAVEVSVAGSNHFMYWNKGQARRDTGYTPPTRETLEEAGEWLQRAQAAAAAVEEEERQQLPAWWFEAAPVPPPPYRPLPPARSARELWYMRASTSSSLTTGVHTEDNAWIHAALPFLSQAGKPNEEDGEGVRPFFIVDPAQQRGIHCRFGQPGIIAEAHYDAGRNVISMQRGRKRYVLSPPSECASLGLMKSGPSARHSELDWSDPSTWDATSPLHGALGLEVVLSAGDVLYLPSNWFHYITSLDVNIQCNSRSGAPALNLDAIRSCGFKSSPTEDFGRHTSKDAPTLQPNRTRDLDAWRAVWPPVSLAGPLGGGVARPAVGVRSHADQVAAAVAAREVEGAAGLLPVVLQTLSLLLPTASGPTPPGRVASSLAERLAAVSEELASVGLGAAQSQDGTASHRGTRGGAGGRARAWDLAVTLALCLLAMAVALGLLVAVAARRAERGAVLRLGLLVSTSQTEGAKSR